VLAFDSNIFISIFWSKNKTFHQPLMFNTFIGKTCQVIEGRRKREWKRIRTRQREKGRRRRGNKNEEKG
jgi:hypothetical protein